MDDLPPAFGDPVEIAPGIETIARCACGAALPLDRKRHCSDPCARRAKSSTPARRAGDARRSARSYAAHQSYRMARRALRLAGEDVARAEALRGRGIVEDWRAVVGLPPSRRAAVDALEGPWAATVGEQPAHVAWGVELRGVPPRSQARHVHGLVAHLVAAPHTQVARWALAMPAGPAGRCAWGAVLFRADDAERFAGRSSEALVGSQRVALTVGPVVRLRAPAPLLPGRYRVTLDALTPVSHMIAGRTRPVTSPTADTILRCSGDLLQRLGLSTGRLHVASVVCETTVEHVQLGGHVGPIAGWVGRVVVECNAPAAWALSLARHAGLGGRVAYGLGRVRVEVQRA